MNFPTLTEVAGEIMFKGASKQDFETSLPEFVKGIEIDNFGDTYVHTDDGKLEFSKKSVAQFVRDRIGGAPGIFNDKDLSPATKMGYLRDKAASLGDTKIVVRQSANAIDGVLSESYRFFDNGSMIQAIMQAAGKNGIPPLDQLYVHRHWSDENARNVFMRIISPENWTYKNGEEYYAGVAFSNNEVGKGSLQVQPALARVACFNYTVTNSVVNMEHRYTSREEVIAAISGGLEVINDYAKAMFEQTQQHKAAEFDNPTAVFELIANRLGFPTKVKEESLDYWANEGEDPSIYGITQAVTWGVQSATNVTGRKKEKWDVRTEIEHEIWTWANELFQVHQGGQDINAYVSASELVSKRKAIKALESWPDASLTVSMLEADGYR